MDILRTDYSTDDSIAHHGIKGMHWGIRRFQPYGKGYSGDGKFIGRIKKKYRDIRDRKYREYDTSYAKGGSASGTRSKYTNIDGSLNEKGRFHSQAYINKQLKKNEKYYNKVIAKYEKRAEEYKDEPEMQKKFLDLAEEAKRTKAAVDNSIKKMDFDSVMRNESYDHEQAMKAVKTAAGVTVGAAGGSLLVGAGLGLSNAMKKDPELRQAVNSFDVKEPIDSLINIVNKTEIGNKAYDAVDTGLRTYFDARAYVIGTGLDQANKRFEKLGIYDKFGTSIGNAANTAREKSGIDTSINSLNTLLEKGGGGSNFIQSGSETISQVLNNPNVASTLSNLNNVNYPGSAVSVPAVNYTPTPATNVVSQAAPKNSHSVTGFANEMLDMSEKKYGNGHRR